MRDGHIIPIQFQRYKIEMKISSLDDDRFEVIITIFEKIDRSWVQLDADPQGFGGSLGTPVEYRWNHDDIRLNIAIIVSELRQ